MQWSTDGSCSSVKGWLLRWMKEVECRSSGWSSVGGLLVVACSSGCKDDRPFVHFNGKL